MIRALLLLILLTFGAAFADEPGFRQFPGSLVPGEAVLTDEAGRARPFADIGGVRPAILALVYYHCPALCGIELADLFAALSSSDLKAGEDYDLFAISIDPHDGSRDATEAHQTYLQRFPASGGVEGWHFLTGDAEALAEIERSVGFTARFDPLLGQYMHPAGVVLLTPKRRVAGYILGVGYSGDDLARGVRDAASGKIATTENPIKLLCFRFDPTRGRYTLDVMNALKLAAGLMVLGIGGMIVISRWKRP
jgi:protein SCO1/2